MEYDQYLGWQILPPNVCQDGDEVWWVNGQIRRVKNGERAHVAISSPYSSRSEALNGYRTVARARIFDRVMKIANPEFSSQRDLIEGRRE